MLIEKPAGVYTRQVREMNEAARQAGTVFAVHFQHRFRREMQVLLANAILQSAWDDAWVELADFDDARYHQQLQRKIAGSSYRKPQLTSPNYDEGY